MELSISNKLPIILVDGSYFIYHRFFGTFKWFSFREKNADVKTCIDIDEFREALIKHTKTLILDLKKFWIKKFNPDKKRFTSNDINAVPIWFAMDCHRVNIWRTELFHEYKGKRNMSESCDMRCFELIYNCIRNELNIPCLELDGLEGDDIIALTHKELRSCGFTGNIVCITDDNDYLQLKDDHTSIYNLKDKDIMNRGFGNPVKDILFKILNGDNSDNIPKVSARLKKNKLKEIMEICITEEDIMNMASLTEEEKKRFELNRQLIDFNYIPQELVKKYKNTYTIMIKID